MDSVPVDKVDTRFVYCRANTALGVQITDEGDVKLFAAYRYDRKAPDIAQRTRKMLAGYTDMITQYESGKSTVG